MFIVFSRRLLMLSRGGDEEVYLLPGEGEAGNGGFPLVQGKGRDRGQEGETKLRKQWLNQSE